MRGLLAGLATLALAVPVHASAAAPTACDFSREGLCGSVTVPLDRSQPDGAKIDIKYVLFKHADTSQPSLGTIFVTEGGPGYSAITNEQDSYSNFLFLQLLQRRDLVLIDQRGTGESGAIQCQPLQSENTDPVDAVRKCGQQLGATSDLYGSAEVAKDVDAVRADLGLQQFDYYGGSYAGVDVEAYASRFPQHLRSVVLDSPLYLPAEGSFLAVSAKQEERAVVLVCSRSRGCSSANPRPAHALHWLLARLRRSPVSGVGYDADGRAHRLQVGERRVRMLLGNDQGTFLNHGEIVAAAQALRHGDSAPLLRLAAENDTPLFHGDDPNATHFSVGDNVARFCVDKVFPWDKQASETQRRAQFNQAVAQLGGNQFAPFSVSGWVTPPPLGYLPDPCIAWPAPTHNPELPIQGGAVIPNVPALILTGDLDQNVAPAESAQLTKVFPDSTLVSLKEAGHHEVFNLQSQCAGEIVRRFISTLSAGDTHCANRIVVHLFARGRFPYRVARGRKGNVSRRSAARITAGTVTDAFLRSFLGGGRGVGLRGGTFQAKFDDTNETLQLHGARFVRDLAVTGTVHFRRYSRVDATLRMRGATHGTVHVSGLLFDPAATRLRIRGVVDGKFVNVTVPAT